MLSLHGFLNSTCKDPKAESDPVVSLCPIGAGVIGMRVSPGIVFPAQISLGMRVSHQ